MECGTEILQHVSAKASPPPAFPDQHSVQNRQQVALATPAVTEATFVLDGVEADGLTISPQQAAAFGAGVQGEQHLLIRGSLHNLTKTSRFWICLMFVTHHPHATTSHAGKEPELELAHQGGEVPTVCNPSDHLQTAADALHSLLLWLSLWPWKTEILPFYDVLTPGKTNTVQTVRSDLCHPQLEGQRGT